ncbi:MAG: CinA family protein [Candidatus Limnocylindrales bacterium]
MDLASLAERLQSVAIERGLTVGTAESCTGGLIGHALTAVPGSSEYYRGGVISYSDELKVGLLDVPPKLLERHGAVSEPVALSMAQGARIRLDVDYAVSVTGVAGPGGGSDLKPVGLTYVAVAGSAAESVRRHLWQGDRAANTKASAAAALELLLETLEGRPR